MLRIALAALIAVGITVAGAGVAAAHNPACHQVAGADGPHYDGADGSQTASQTAFEKNKNLGGSDHPEHANSAEGCSVGNSQSPHSDN